MFEIIQRLNNQAKKLCVVELLKDFKFGSEIKIYPFQNHLFQNIKILNISNF
jgi:hypothetical protein